MGSSRTAIVRAANACSREAERRGRSTYLDPEDGIEHVRFEDGELVTICRLMQCGPVCPHPCVSCRDNPVTFGTFRLRLARDERSGE